MKRKRREKQQHRRGSPRPPGAKREDGFEESAFAAGPDDPPLRDIAVGEAEALSEAEGTIRAGNLAGRSMWAAIWILALPVLLQQTMQAFVGLADKVFAGRLPAEMIRPGLDAVGVGSYIGWFVGIAMAGLGIGGQAIIARAMGAGRRREAHRALGNAVVLSVLWGFIVGLALWTAAGLLAAFTGLTDEATMLFKQYVRTIAASMPFCAVMMVGWMCLHGAGETAKPAAIAITVNIINMIASWIFSGVDLTFNGAVLVNPFPFDLHVLGIALGTAVSYLIGAALTVMVLARGVPDLRLRPRWLRLSRSMTRRIVRIGVPNFMEGIAMWGVNLFVLMFIGWIEIARATGGGLQGAHIIAVQWEAFSFLPGFAIGTAAGALAGQYLGAGNPRMAQKAMLVCTGIGILIMGGLGVVFITQAELLTRIISPDPLHMEHAPNLLRICGAVQVFFAITMVVRQGLRGVGDTRWTFILTTVSSYGVRLPAAYLLGVHLGLGIEGIWFALCGEFVVRAALFSGRFIHGGWKRVRV